MGFWFEKGSRARRVLVGLTVLIIVVGVARIGAQFIVHQVLGISTYNYSEYFRKDDRLRLLTWTKYYSPHPYFGYETAAIRQFERDREHRSADDYVIAVIGGSVAEMFGSYIEEHLELLKPLMAALPEARGKHLVFANLALGGSHQPQQYFVASFFLNNVDLFIDIDGFNEAMIISVLPLYPLEYPSVLRTTYERIPAGRIYRRMAASVISLYQFLNWVPLKVPVLARSPIYFLFWNAASRGLNATVQSLQQKYYDAQVEPGPRLPPDEILERKVRLWRSYSELEYALISRIARKRSYVFLQPNQYVTGSKPLSQVEKRTAMDRTHFRQVDTLMRRFMRELPAIRKSGVKAYDLTGIYETTTDTVYIDTCCHLNDRGNELMAKAIVASIVRDH